MSRGSRVRSPPGVSTLYSACSVMVIIGASQALDPGSIPGRRTSSLRGISSIGRVRALQARGTGIETLMLHLDFFINRWVLLTEGCQTTGNGPSLCLDAREV